jgi:hypothetical protein
MILNKLNPVWVATSLKKNINEYSKYIKYKKIIYNLNQLLL